MKRYGAELTRHEKSKPTSRRGRTLDKEEEIIKNYQKTYGAADHSEKLPFGLNRDHDMTPEEIEDHKARVKAGRIERNKRKKEAHNVMRTIENNERFVKEILKKGAKHEK